MSSPYRNGVSPPTSGAAAFGFGTPSLPSNPVSANSILPNNNHHEEGRWLHDAYDTIYGYRLNAQMAINQAKNTVNNITGSIKDGVSQAKDKITGLFSDPAGDGIGLGDPGYPTGGGGAGYSAPSTPQQMQYIDAPYAELYGMDAATAYNEALANTAYQRKVKDLKAAGLNPVLGISGSGAANFYGSPAVSSFGGASIGSSGSGRDTASISGTAQKLSYWLPTLANGLTTMAVSIGTKNGMTGFSAGQIAQNVVSGALGALRNHTD